MAKAAKTKTDDIKRDSSEGRIKLNMTFSEAIKLAANTPKPKKKAKK